MKIVIDGETTVDTESDLSAAERHILQKLFGWRDLVASVGEFRVKARQCLEKGWNDEGPVRPGAPLQIVIRHLEKEVQSRVGVRGEG